MSTQEIQDYKINWLRKKSFQVKGNMDDYEECTSWLKETLSEKVWETSINYENGQCAYYFENPQDAEKFRERFLGDSRTVDIG